LTTHVCGHVPSPFLAVENQIWQLKHLAGCHLEATQAKDLIAKSTASSRKFVRGHRQQKAKRLGLLLVYFAFRANYRSARAYEEVTVTTSELTVRKVSHRGDVRQWTLNPLWVRLERIVHEEFGIERLLLVSHGRRLVIAGFLSPDEKASFARALSGVLGEARRGPPRTVIG
jgi:hypothetical protein